MKTVQNNVKVIVSRHSFRYSSMYCTRLVLMWKCIFHNIQKRPRNHRVSFGMIKRNEGGLCVRYLVTLLVPTQLPTQIPQNSGSQPRGASTRREGEKSRRHGLTGYQYKENAAVMPSQGYLSICLSIYLILYMVAQMGIGLNGWRREEGGPNSTEPGLGQSLPQKTGYCV